MKTGKKPVAVFLVFVFFSLCCVFGITEAGSDYRLKAMGHTGASDSAGSGAYFRNPASLFFHKKTDSYTFFVGLEDKFTDRMLFPDVPCGEFRIRFAGSDLSAAFFIENTVSEQLHAETDGYMNAEKDIGADFCFSAGYSFFSAGLGLSAGAKRVRNNFAVSSDSRGLDLLLNMVTENYVKPDNAQFFNLRGGIRFDYSGFVFGLLAPSAYSYKDGKSDFSWEKLAESLNLGLSYSGEPYSKRAHLNFVVLNINAEFENIFSDNAVFHAGTEVIFQFLPDFNLSLRGGYVSMLNTFSAEYVTLGTGVKAGLFNMNFFIELPVNGETEKRYGLALGMIK